MLSPITSATGVLDDGTVYYEHQLGDFVRRQGPWTTDIGFSADEARAVAAVLESLGPLEELAIALYPWVKSAWSEIVANGWTTLHERRFVRHRWLGSMGVHRWVVGNVHSADKLVEVVEWAWTLPGRDSLLFVPTNSTGVAPLLSEFEDDQEDSNVIELRLLRHYPYVASRGLEGRYLRVFSTSPDGLPPLR
jgi:tetrahydromethanopterin S-methyltransferase subunit F